MWYKRNNTLYVMLLLKKKIHIPIVSGYITPPCHELFPITVMCFCHFTFSAV